MEMGLKKRVKYENRKKKRKVNHVKRKKEKLQFFFHINNEDETLGVFSLIKKNIPPPSPHTGKDILNSCSFLIKRAVWMMNCHQFEINETNKNVND